MMQFCSVTGRMRHLFDKATHRCKCGRWERGFKPKAEPTMPRAECQICERTQALVACGGLGHHGYKRPGCGYIFGDCMGTSHKPYPATDALEKYLAVIQAFVVKCEAQLMRLPTLTEISYPFTAYPTPDFRKGEKRTTTLRRGDEYTYSSEHRTSLPAFADQIKIEISKVERDLDFARKDEARVIARIAKAK